MCEYDTILNISCLVLINSKNHYFMLNQVSNISSIDLQRTVFISFPIPHALVVLNLFDSTENLHIFEAADS